jgi:hypothetical protein
MFFVAKTDENIPQELHDSGPLDCTCYAINRKTIDHKHEGLQHKGDRKAEEWNLTFVISR